MYVRDRLNLYFHQLKCEVPRGNLPKLSFDPRFKSVRIFLTKSMLENLIYKINMFYKF